MLSLTIVNSMQTDKITDFLCNGYKLILFLYCSSRSQAFCPEALESGEDTLD